MTKNLYRLVTVLTIAVLMIGPALRPAPAQAQTANAPHFFSILEDMPLMPGLTEIAEGALIFDKPGGRIIESRAISETMAPQSVRAFYATTLPQLGWRPLAGTATDTALFEREQERLSLKVARDEGITLLEMMVSPAPDAK